MAPVTNARVIFNQIPDGYPKLGETLLVDRSQTIDLENATLPDGSVLVKILNISIDPYLRNRLGDRSGQTSGKPLPRFPLGQPLFNWAVVKVLRSNNPQFPPGAHVYGRAEFAEYQVLSAADLAAPGAWRVLPEEPRIPWSAYVGVAGMPGQTGWYGWKEIAHAKKGETIYVSTAAGPVGSMVVQLAKAEGLKVIGSAGSEDKLAFLRDIGADVVFNYKTTSIDAVLKEHGPIDIYWDHVSNAALGEVLPHMREHGRIVHVGSVASYNAKPTPIENFINVLDQRLTIRGFLIHDHEAQYADAFYATVPGQVARGELRYTETVVRSLDDAPQLFIDVMRGANSGKAVVVLDTDSA